MLFLADPTNQQILSCIEKALLVFCLDKPNPQLEHADSFTDAQTSVVLSNIFHGNGVELNGCNRWYDHALQVGKPCSITSTGVLVKCVLVT